MELNFFNPKSQKEEDFLNNFVARQNTLKFFLQQLRLTAVGQPARHILVVAPRGYGKTSLLRRISIEVRKEAEFSERYIALTFREEQHNIISLDVFWRNCLVALQEAREDEGATAAEIDDLDAMWVKFAPRSTLKRDEQDGEPAWQAFQAHCQQLGRRPILLIDNLDSLLAGLTAQHQWSLRRILQREDSPVLMAAASRYPESTHDGKAAFYDFFSIQTLSRLSDDEVMQCLRTLALHRGEKGKKVINLLNNDPGRISALNTLAGGNPRTLNVLYSVLEADMSADILSQLSAMLDTFTGWYQARTEEIAPQSRAVFDALALNWNPIKAADLSLITGLDTPTVSSHLSKLEKAGYAETVSLSTKGKGRNGYQVSERFYNIWYLMRNGPRRAQKEIKFLTAFLQSCFNVSERRTMAEKMLMTDCVEPAYALALASTFKNGKWRTKLLDQVQSITNEGLSEYVAVAKNLKLEIATLKNKKQKKSIERNSYFNRACQLHEEGNLIEAELSYLKAIEENPKDYASFCNLGSILSESERYEEAENNYKIAIFNNPTISFLYLNFGQLLNNKLEKYAEAEHMYRKSLELNSTDALAYFALGSMLHRLSKNYDEVELLYKKAIDLDSKFPMVNYNLGHLLAGYFKRYSEAATFYQKELVLGSVFIELHIELGDIFLYHLDRYEDASQSYMKAIEFDLNSYRSWMKLGNIYLDKKADIEKSMHAYQMGLSIDNDDWLLNANYAYLLALHKKDFLLAQKHATKAIKVDKISQSGRYLLCALPNADDTDTVTFDRIWHQVDLAVNCEDTDLWTNYLDDLQRLLWYVIVNGQGVWFKEKMEAAQYPLQFAPLYVAFKAALEGEDVLLQINPETRQPAQRIYDGLAHQLKIYPKSTRK
jgi:tetratricopeptide (TPR) repeat protein